ncbi:hypothetical protein [Xanthobacter sediminis]
MSLPDWNDLPPAAKKAADDMACFTWGIDDFQAGQCALDIYNAIKEHVPPDPPEVFPLFQRPLDAPRRNKLGLAPCPFCGGDAAFGTISYSPGVVKEQGWSQDTFHSVNCVRCGTNNGGVVGYPTQADAARHWNRRMPGADGRPRVRVRAGRRVR